MDAVSPVKAEGGVQQSRRRLIQAGLAAAPVMLAVSGRSAMAGGTPGTTAKCLSPMAWCSANPTSGQAVGSISPKSMGNPGCNPKQWKPCETTQTFPNTPSWPSGCKPFSTIKYPGGKSSTNWVSGQCRTYSGLSHKITVNGQTQDPGWNSGTVLSWLDSRSCSNILIDEADSDTLKAHTCAAYLNAKLAEDNGKRFPVSSADVKACYQERKLGTRSVTDAQLLAYFKQTCA
ncbi:MAG: hypothetical protein NTZ15_17685 [Burkholderiales bacterium]|nr:hypothetical protein [Burkholderiales bacterium]